MDLQAEIEELLKKALIKQDLSSFALELLGNSEKGDGYIGDILFVSVSGKAQDDASKQYDLVLKCGKKSPALRNSAPVRSAFENEIYVYDKIFPEMRAFQEEKGIADVFDSVPKCYGTFMSDDKEVIALQNLKKIGYDLWDKKKPLTNKHVRLVLGEYAKWHAVSLAMQDQEPKRFEELCKDMVDIWVEFDTKCDVDKMFTEPIMELGGLLKNNIDEHVLDKWQEFERNVPNTIKNLLTDTNRTNIIMHGDCWNNNFMFKNGNDDSIPSRVAILDWQMSRLASPVFDLSYFLYSCISSKDLKNFDQLLHFYHNQLGECLVQFGSDPDLYRFDQLMEEWKRFARFGILMATLAVRIALYEREEVVDISETAEQGLGFSDSFTHEIKNINLYKDRMKCIVEHVVQREFI